jgi:hypothetical protein
MSAAQPVEAIRLLAARASGSFGFRPRSSVRVRYRIAGWSSSSSQRIVLASRSFEGEGERFFGVADVAVRARALPRGVSTMRRQEVVPSKRQSSGDGETPAPR